MKMKADELRDLARTEWAVSDKWYKRAAVEAWRKGHLKLIDSPTDKTIYLARFWLTPPKLDDHKEWESGESVMLHFFVRPDHDRALHSHPWKFKTTILHGGYLERLPPKNWKPTSKMGPPPDKYAVWRTAGETIEHGLHDLHCVSRLKRDTWTLMVTGERVQHWGFFPEGEKFVLADDYLTANSRD